VAMSNRDRVGRMFDLLSPALDDFITRVVGPELPADTDWSMLVALKDQQKHKAGKAYSRTDPHVQLRMLSEDVTGQVKPGWRPFNDYLAPAQRSFASELRDVRNTWAHGGAFSADDTYRALDTAERLLRAVDAVEAADQVEALRKDLRRVTAEADDRRVVKSTTVQSGSQGLRPWREVLAPHDDVATGNFRASEFAADLYKVASGDPGQSQEYANPIEFFRRTYLTEGLRDLIGRALARLDGDMNASPVVNLQTNFGGGKTHSMLSLWHLAAGIAVQGYPQEVQELLTSRPVQGLLADSTIRRVALVGNHVAPSGSTKPDGTKVNTLWGELAWQLGGRDAYDLVADADRSSTAPGQALHTLLAAYAPAVVLIDEWVAYARQLYDRDDLAGGTFDTQFTFAQSLTEAVKATPGVFVAISIPASYDPSSEGEPSGGSAEEVGGANGREALRRLQNVVRRVADQWQPASSQEAYEIVRRRLFVEPDAAALAAIGATSRGFVELYRKHSADFPREARENDYEDRIRRSYPVHPELFDRLYEDWSTLERFQRTRGVLRLMNTVIHALWAAGDASPLIMPGSVPLSAPAVNAELTQYVGDAWKAVIDADVDGPHSVPVAIDAERPLFGQRSLTQRLARAVFFGAAPTIGTAQKGLVTERVFLGTAVPGDVPGNFHSALNQLADRATYYYSAAGKHWYDTQANITRRAKDQAERLPEDDVWAEIIRRLDAHRVRPLGFDRVHVAPEDSAEIPDVDEARLVIVHPRAGYSRKAKDESPAVAFARQATDRRGTTPRTHRNMVVFLAGDCDRLEELQAAAREYLGWRHVHEQAHELDLTPAQQRQAAERQNRADQTVADRLLGTYHWVLAAEQPRPDQHYAIRALKAEGASASLTERVSRKLGNDSMLDDQRSAASIRIDLEQRVGRRWAEGHVSVGELWTWYTMHPYMPRLRDRHVLEEGIRSAADVLLWQTDAFAVAQEYDEASGDYRGLVLPDDGRDFAVRDSTLLVQPARAQEQRGRELAAQRAAGSDGAQSTAVGGGTSGGAGGDGRTSESSSEPSRSSPQSTEPSPTTRFFGVKQLSRDSYASDFRKIVDEVLLHLEAVPGADVELRLEIAATAPDGFDDDKVRTVGENARTLKFEQSGFERD
jgi:predicted AAA+ superfamily ATPase